MNKIIKIKNSKLNLVIEKKIESYLHSKTLDAVDLDNKKKLRYQFITFKNNKGVFKSISTSGKVSINFPDNTIETIYLEKSKVTNPDDLSYSDEEKEYILRIALATSKLYPGSGVIEALILSSEYSEVIEFYNSLPCPEKRNDLDNVIEKVIRESKKKIQKPSSYKYYEYYNKYSVLSLLRDLIKDGASIIIDGDLIDYSRISRKYLSNDAIEISTPETSILSSFKITGIQGNKSRANLSLSYEIPVIAKVKENLASGVSSETLELKSIRNFCVIHDGIKNTNNIAVKISPSLAGKFKRMGLIQSKLLYQGEYLISIESLPVVSRSQTLPISGYHLAKLEVQYQILNVKIRYADKFRQSSLSPSEKYLNKLGIYNKELYSPSVNKASSSPLRSYETVNFVFNSSGSLKVSLHEFMKCYQSPLARANNPSVNSIFSEVKEELETSTPDDLIKEYEREQKEIRSQISMRKFRYLMSRRDNFIDPLSSVRVNIPKYKIKDVKVGWKIFKDTVTV